MRSSLHRRALAFLPALLAAMSSSAQSLHPLATPLPAAEISFVLRDAFPEAETGLVECVYRPRRERDVKKERHFHLFDWPGRIGSRDRVTVQREEFHSVRHELRATDGAVTFTVPLRDPDPDYGAYQLAEVRVAEFAFSRWFDAPPALDPAFGLSPAAERLAGRALLGGISADPLRGNLPLWPGLRRVELAIVRERRPDLQLWDPLTKHHWDGWRQNTPDYWPGGRSILARHTAAPTVWWAHEVFAFPPGGEPSVARPVPPAGALPGAGLEIFWPEGDSLEFPDVRFGNPVTVLTLPLASLDSRARARLVEAASLRPGAAPGSMSPEAWRELEAGAAAHGKPPPVELTLERGSGDGGAERLVVRRRDLAEPWVVLFGAEYDDGRRVALTVLALHPHRWPGALPD